MIVTRERMREELTNYVEKLEEELETLKYENGNLKECLYETGLSLDDIREIKIGKGKMNELDLARKHIEEITGDLEEMKEERDLLAYENKNFAVYLDKLGLSSDEISIIANLGEF